jgi:hypothetical protein
MQLPHLIGFAESQRDFLHQPKVARHELPWETVPTHASTLKEISAKGLNEERAVEEGRQSGLEGGNKRR